MPPISSSRSAPLTTCSSPAASSWPSQVRKSCLGALVRPGVDNSATRFMLLSLSGKCSDSSMKHSRPFVLGACSCGADQSPVGDGPDHVAPIVRAVVGVLHGVDPRRCSSGGLEGVRAGLLAL